MYLLGKNLTSEIIVTALATNSHLQPHNPNADHDPQDAGGVQQVQQLINKDEALQVVCSGLQAQPVEVATLDAWLKQVTETAESIKKRNVFIVLSLIFY